MGRREPVHRGEREANRKYIIAQTHPRCDEHHLSNVWLVRWFKACSNAASILALILVGMWEAAGDEVPRLAQTRAATQTIQTAQAGPPIKPPPFDWTGWYAGVNVAPFAGHLHGVSGGFVLGGDVQYGWAVFGFEGDIDAISSHGSAACVGGSCNFNSRWSAAVLGRAGIAIDRYMPFVSAGVAFSEIDVTPLGAPTTGSTRTGWSIGAGIEVALGAGWSARGEYRRVDFGTLGCAVGCTTPEFHAYSDSARLSFMYRFAPLGGVRAARGPPIKPPPF